MHLPSQDLCTWRLSRRKMHQNLWTRLQEQFHWKPHSTVHDFCTSRVRTYVPGIRIAEKRVSIYGADCITNLATVDPHPRSCQVLRHPHACSRPTWCETTLYVPMAQRFWQYGRLCTGPALNCNTSNVSRRGAATHHIGGAAGSPLASVRRSFVRRVRLHQVPQGQAPCPGTLIRSGMIYALAESGFMCLAPSPFQLAPDLSTRAKCRITKQFHHITGPRPHAA